MSHDTAETASEPRGVAGWLLIFCIASVVLSPLFSLLLIAQAPLASLDVAGLTMLTAGCAVTLLGILAGIGVWRVRSWAPRAVVAYLLSLVVVPLVSVVIAGKRGAAVDVASLLRNVIFAAAWASYFSMSKRVKNTFTF